MSGDPTDSSKYGGRLSDLFPSQRYLNVGIVAAGISLGLFLLGYIITLFGNIDYLAEPEGYLGAAVVFFVLVWLGLADRIYVDMWNDVRLAFAVDDETYWTVVGERLERIYDGRRVLVYASIIAVLPFVAITAIYLPGSPFRDAAVSLFLANEPSPYPPGILRVLEFYVLVGAVIVLTAAVLNGLVNHLALVNEVTDLPFRNIRTAASDLEPLGRFTITSATVWFAGVSGVVLWIEVGLTGSLGMVTIVLLVFLGSVFFLAPQLTLHDALSDAKWNAIAGIQAEYDRLYEAAQRLDEPSENLPFQLEVTDRRLESAEAINTWVYDLSSVGKLVAASLIPWLTLIQEFISTIRLGG